MRKDPELLPGSVEAGHATVPVIRVGELRPETREVLRTVPLPLRV